MSCPESPVCSRLIDIEEKRRAYQIHQILLMKAKYQIDTTRPQTAPRVLRYEQIRKKEIMAQKNAEIQNSTLLHQYRLLQDRQVSTPSSPVKNKLTPINWTDIMKEDSIKNSPSKKSSQRNAALFSPKARGRRQLISRDGMVVTDDIGNSPLNGQTPSKKSQKSNDHQIKAHNALPSLPDDENDLITTGFNNLKNVMEETAETLGETK